MDNEDNKKEDTACEQKQDDKLFGNNVNTFSDGDEMSREYLKVLYGEDMEFLNRDVRLTRTKYLKMYGDIETSFEKELKQNRKNLIVPMVVVVIMMLVSIALMLASNELWDVAFISEIVLQARKSLMVVSGIYKAFSRVLAIIDIVGFIYFITGFVKRDKRIKERKKIALYKLETHKKECMMYGTYDVGR